MTTRIEKLISGLNLQPHPEGGYYKEIYRSEQVLLSPVHRQPRNSVTDIYFLLCAGQVSRFHRVCHDEIWNFYEGAPLELVEIDEKTTVSSTTILGYSDQIPTYKHCVKAGNWQAATTQGEYTLVGCTVAPGFDFSDFSFLCDTPGNIRAFAASHDYFKAFL